MGTFGPILFGLGIIIAISGGAKVPEKIGEFPDTLPVFLVGAVMATVGLLMWRRAHALAAKAAAAPSDNLADDPFRLLESLQAPMAALGEELNLIDDGEQVCARTDALLEGFVLPFAEVRAKVIDRLGMASGAEILVTVAYAERMLNRTWSAAADGHLVEARTVYPDARQAFEEAWRMAKAATESE